MFRMCSFLQVITGLALIGSISGNLERALERAGGSGWSYAGQGNYWPVTHPFCGGKRQSPINIDNSRVFSVDTGTLKFREYSKNLAGKLANVGSSLKFTPDATLAEDLPGIRDRDGPLGGDNYELLQF